VSKPATWIAISLTFSSAGKMAATIWPASFANSWSKATRAPMRVCVALFSACFLVDGSIRLIPSLWHRLSLPHDKPLSSCFVAPPELRVEEQEQLDKLRQIHPGVELAYDLVQQFAHPARAHAPESASMLGLSRWKAATFPNSSLLPSALRKTKTRCEMASPGGSIMVW
jgi:hypothetical protein